MPNSVKYTVFIAFLEFIGCQKTGQKGSHEKYKKRRLVQTYHRPKKRSSIS